MTHLSADELKTWYQQGRAADRDRVVGHLAECDACRRALSALAVAEEVDVASPAVAVAEAVPLGYAARKNPSVSGGWAAWLRPAYALAGAAVVVLAVLWMTGPDRTAGDDAVRSSELMALAPSGTTSAREFRWESPFEAAKYRVTLRDAKGVLVHSTDATASPVVLDESARGRLKAGADYTWQVSAVDAAGGIIAESKPATFRYQP